MKASRGSTLPLYTAGILSGSWMFWRSSESQVFLKTLKRTTSGPVVSPKRESKADRRISSAMWWRHASQRSCRCNWSWRKVQAPLWTPVFEAVVSKPIATIFSAQPQSLRAASTARASISPVESAVSVMQRSWLTFSFTRTTARRLTFP